LGEGKPARSLCPAPPARERLRLIVAAVVLVVGVNSTAAEGQDSVDGSPPPSPLIYINSTMEQRKGTKSAEAFLVLLAGEKSGGTRPLLADESDSPHEAS
jgi:hypothetical protein